MSHVSYHQRRSQIETYFDRTAVQAWERLTSDAPVGRIRASVRAGRDRMRQTLLDWLPQDLSGRRILDAGCGTGAFAVEAARRGAQVLAIDLSPKLVKLAQDRMPENLGSGSIDFQSGDMLNASLGHFDHVVAMDSVIHYGVEDAVAALGTLAARTSTSIVFTFAPRTPLLSLMIKVGQLFPRGDRAPWLQPMSEPELLDLMGKHASLQDWKSMRSERIASGFYTSQAMEWRRT